MIDELISSGYEVIDFSPDHVAFNGNSFIDEDYDKADNFELVIDYDADEDGYFYISGGPQFGPDMAEAMNGVGYSTELDASYPFKLADGLDAELVLSVVGNHLDQFTPENMEQAFSDYYGPNYRP